MTSVK